MDQVPKLIKGAVSTDDRGEVRYINDFDFKDVKRFYQVSNHRAEFVRAWHGHKNEAKYVYVAKGAAIICAFPMSSVEDRESLNIHLETPPFRFVLSENNPSILYIPNGYYNGFMTLKPDTTVIFFSTSTLIESSFDDFRLPANVLVTNPFYPKER